MDDPIPRLIRELRGEACPPSVTEHVARRIARDAATRPRRPRRPAFVLAVVAASLAVIPGLPVLRSFLSRPDTSRPVAVATRPAEPDHAQIVEQTHVALALVGRFLLDAGVRAENAVLDEAVPPLLKGLHSAKTKLVSPL